MSRVVALIDMDCFYVQVEQRDNVAIRGRPCAVVQGSGLLIAISYEARALGVVRGHRVNDARSICPDIHFFNVPEPRGKADLTKYREAGAEVITVLSEFERCVVERASIDEAYVDMTQEVNFRLAAMETAAITADQIPNTFVVGWESEDAGNTGTTSGRLDEWLCAMDESDRRLAMGAIVTEEMRAAVLQECSFRCSAGIAHNKILAKLICTRHKPNKQTVLPQSAVNDLLTKTPVQKMRLLGGKLGTEVTQQLGVEFVAELCQFPEKQLHLEFGEKQGSWLYQVCRGIDSDPVKVRKLAQSIGCGKNFPGKAILDTDEKIQRWLRTMSLELGERLVKDKRENKREARLLTVHARTKAGSHTVEASKSCPMLRCDADRLCSEAMRLLHKFQRPADSHASRSTWAPAFLSLSISASKFEYVRTNKTSIKQFAFKTQPSLRVGSSGSTERSSGITHGSSVTKSETCVPVRGSSVSEPASSDPKPGPYAPKPRSSIPKPGSSIPKPGSSDITHGSYVPKPGSSVSVPGSPVSMPGSYATSGSSVDHSCHPMQESSDSLLGSSASIVGSSVARSSDPIPRTTTALCGTSSGGDDSFFLDYVRKSRNTSCLSTDVQYQKSCSSKGTSLLSSEEQPLLENHRNITSGRSDTCVIMPSCHGDTACRSRLSHDDSCRLEHDSCLVQCKDAVTKTDNSDFRLSPDLKCEGKHNSGDVSKKVEQNDTNVKCMKAAGQIAETVAGLSQLDPPDGTSVNHPAESLVDDTSVDTIRCHQCGDTIEVGKIAEHSDFHLAVKLQERETFTSNSCKRKSTGASEAKKRRNSVTKTSTLHKFFEAI